jgi:glycine oxidase
MTHHQSASVDVVVLGAGMVGTAVAWRCAQRGLTVQMIDPRPDAGAWQTAAGMLAPITELQYGETPLLRLSLAGLAGYPAFAAEVSAASGRPIGFLTSGAIAVAWDGADLAALRDLHAFGTGLGIKAELLTGRDLRQLEPALAPGLPGGLLALGDHQVEPRLLHAALTEAARRAGVERMVGAAELVVHGERVAGVSIEGRLLAAGTVVLAAGAWSAQVPGVPPEFRPPTRPVKGQTLRLRLPGAPRLTHMLRATVKGTPVYVVPRADGQLVIGASSEEVGFDLTPRAGVVYELLRDAQSLLPELAEASWEQVSTGLRPGSPDNAPIVGASGLDGLLHATGHYRNGVLLAPITADAIADLITTGSTSPDLAPFTPARFAQAVVA